MSTALPLAEAPAPTPDATDPDTLERIRAKLIRPLPTDRLWGWLLPLAVTGLAGIPRFWRITRPGGATLTSKNGIIFDETYYAHDSWSLLHHGVETNGKMNGAAFVVHPPLGKWMMALGEWMFDHGKTVVFNNGSAKNPMLTIYPASPMSFRIMGAVVGTLAVLILARTARRMFNSTGLGVVAGLLLGLDGLELVQSRTAMLDIYLMFWIVAAFACLVVDRDDGRRRLAERLTHPLDALEWGPSLGFRKWRWLAGLCLGIACGTKWNGAYYVPAFILLAIVWDISARRTAGAQLRAATTTVHVVGPVLVAFLLLPAATYVVSWTGWFLSNGQFAYDHDKFVQGQTHWWSHDWAVFRGWWAYQREIYHFDATLHAAHPYLSSPWGWLLLERPVAYYYETPAGCGTSSCSQEVLGLGNPALWWASIPALIATGWAWIARRDWRASAIVVMFLFGFVPWVVQYVQLVHTTPVCTPSADCHRTMFLFYLLPDVPFMALAVTLGIGLLIGRRTAQLPRRAFGLTVSAAYLAAVITLFGYFYPILAAKNISNTDWNARMWFTQCNTAPHRDQHVQDAPCWI